MQTYYISGPREIGADEFAARYHNRIAAANARRCKFVLAYETVADVRALDFMRRIGVSPSRIIVFTAVNEPLMIKNVAPFVRYFLQNTPSLARVRDGGTLRIHGRVRVVTDPMPHAVTQTLIQCSDADITWERPDVLLRRYAWRRKIGKK